MSESTKKIHEGTVVSMTGDKLTTNCCDGKQHQHTVAKDAKVTCDGHASKASDLKAGTCVHVTTDEKSMATAIDSGKHIHASSHKA
jgi:hypothetical protein